MKTVTIPRTRPPLRRIHFIHEQLQQGRYPNCPKLSRALEVKAVRTILRDIDFMRDQMGLPIAYDELAHGYYYMHPVEQLPGMAVTENEIFALLVAQKAVAHYRGTPFHRPLQSAYQKLAASLDAEAVVHLESLDQAMDIRVTGPEDLDEQTFLVVSRAVHQRRPLRFRYRKHAAKTMERRAVHPYQLLCANHRWYVIGHDLRRNAVRVFVLSRMRSPEVLEGTFKKPADFRVADFLKGSFGIFRGNNDYEVVVDLDRWGADLVRGRRWHASQAMTELPGGELRVRFHLDNLQEIEPWVLSWGTHATVVRPKALVDRLKVVAAELGKRYAKSARKNAATRQQKLPFPGVPSKPPRTR